MREKCRSFILPLLGVLLGIGLVIPATAEAQYFGRNKVQYDTFDFRILQTEHFEIYYYPEEEQIIREAARMAERWYARIARVLDWELSSVQPLILYSSHPEFEQTNAVFGFIGESTGGVTEALKRRIVLPLAGPLKESDHVIGHELVHAFQFDITSGSGGSIGFVGPTALVLPLWFIEGMAEYLSLGAIDPHTAMWMRDAASSCCELPSVIELANPKFFPYRYGQAFWAFVAGEWGDEVIGKVLKVAGRSADPIQALTAVLQISPDSLTAEWHKAIRSTYAQIEARTNPPTTYGPMLLSEENSGSLNVGPALSPDGNRVVFLSEKDLFSIEMFLYDIEQGKIIKKLTSTVSDPHFESLQFINSAGTWSPDGSMFVLAGVVKGRPALKILDAENGRKIKELKFKELGEVFTPSFSPDSRQIVFSAIIDGYTDLFIVDVETEEYRRLTNDLYADLQPDWSPDGRSVAFVTDRFSTDLTNLDYGNYRLATIDPVNGEIQALPVFGRGKHINPQWSPDGQSLYFITDVSGISNVYRYEFSGGELFQLTDLTTGVSGITALSPALSVASDEGSLVYTAYVAGNYNLYQIADEVQLAGEAITGPIAGVSPAVLPPTDRQPGLVSTLLAAPDLGLVDTLTFANTDYKSKLSLDFVSQPLLVAGADEYGAFVGGGISLYFSDMLGNRNLSTLININSSSGDLFKSSALVIGYENRRTRFNWKLEGGQIPLLSRGFRSGFANQDGRDVFIEEESRFWQVNRFIETGFAYPISRSQRIEIMGGFRGIDFSAEIRRRTFDASTGEFLGEETIDLPSDTINTVNTGIASLALVYDNTLFGGTGPISGQRYRLEASPSFGSLDYVGLLADYRRYWYIKAPVTLAIRGVTFGRYGTDGEDPRLADLFIGYPTLIRGYNDGSFSAEECIASQEDPTSGLPQGCPVFDQLFGSRMMVFNAEARVPLLGFFGLIRSPMIPPVEAVAFVDGGVAWTSGSSPQLPGVQRGDKDFVSSYGLGARMNLLGLAVFELVFVHPNNRPTKGWYWQFSFTRPF